MLYEITCTTDAKAAQSHFEKSVSLLKEIKAENELAFAFAGYESVEKPFYERLVKNVQMQGFRNRGPAPKGWGLSRAKRK